MRLVKDRFPNRSSIYMVFEICALPVNIWSWILMLNKISGLLLKWAPFQLLEIFAYTQSFALLESLVLFGFLVTLAFTLPKHFFRERFVSQATVITLCLSIWAVGVHMIVRANARSETLEWNEVLFITWVLICMFLLMLMSIAIRKSANLEKWIIDRVDQATLLSYLFVSINIISFLFVITRHIYLLITS